MHYLVFGNWISRKHGVEKISHNAEENESGQDVVPLPLCSTSNLNIPQRQKSQRSEFFSDDKDRQTKPGAARKRVSYAEPEVLDASVALNLDEKKLLHYSTGQTELLQKLEESYQVIHHFCHN